MIEVAVLDDWQDVARSSADWGRLAGRAEVTFFADALVGEDAAAAALAEFDVLLTVQDRMAMPASLIARLPKLKMGQPKEVADLCAYLCSVQAGYITGQSIAIDGGINRSI